MPSSSDARSEDIAGGHGETTKFARSTKVLRWLRESRPRIRNAVVKAK